MTLEQQVCSLDLAKKLRRLGVSQNGIHTWQRRQHDQPYKLDSGGPFETSDKDAWFSAFTVAELGEMLPAKIRQQDGPASFFNYECTTYKSLATYAVAYVCEKRLNDFIAQAHTEADARAKMLIYLIENELITARRLVAGGEKEMKL